jgi:transcriptional regulator with XRE-family HTH domain
MSAESRVSQLLREARIRAGLSQRDLAERARTSQSVVGRIEAGLTSPSLDTLARLVQVAGFDVKVELVPTPIVDAVIEAYKQGVDRSLIRENLKRSVDERLRLNAELQLFGNEVRRAMRVAEGAP